MIDYQYMSFFNLSAYLRLPIPPFLQKEKSVLFSRTIHLELQYKIKHDKLLNVKLAGLEPALGVYFLEASFDTHIQIFTEPTLVLSASTNYAKAS